MQCSVVPETAGVTEAEFRAAMLAGLARCEKAHGAKALAFVMDVTTKQLGNVQLNGATPGSKRLWDALAACPTALDDIARLYGFELVRREAGEAERLGTVPIAALLAKVAAAESPVGPGGTAVTHGELLSMEDDIRAVHARTARWIDDIKHLRAPRAVGE